MSIINLNTQTSKAGQILTALALVVYLAIVLWTDNSSANEQVMSQQIAAAIVMSLAAIVVVLRVYRHAHAPGQLDQLRSVATGGAFILLGSWVLSRIWFLMRRVFLELQMPETAGLITQYTPQFNGLHYMWLVLACGMLSAPWLFEKFGSWWIIVSTFIGVFVWHFSLIIAGLI